MPVHRDRKRALEPRRPHVAKVQLTAAELAEVQERAGRYTHGNVSAYLRDAGLHRRMDPLPPPPPQINRDAYLSFLRVGALLNQAASHLNRGNIWTTERQLAAFRQQLADLAAAVEEVRRLLLRRSA